VDSHNDTVTFNRAAPTPKEVTRISVARVEIPFAGAGREPVEVVAAIQCTSEINFRKRAIVKPYTPGEVGKQIETIGGKTVYSMRYVVTDRRLGTAVESVEAVYVYLPPNWKENRRAYLFGTAQAQKIDDVIFPTDLSGVTAVISSFREK